MDEGGGGGESGGYGGVVGVGVLVQRQQTHHAVQRPRGISRPLQLRGDHLPFGHRTVDHHIGTQRPVVVQRLACQPYGRMLLVSRRQHQQPRTGQDRGSGFRNRLPSDPVPPGVDGRLLTVLTPPGGEHGECGHQGLDDGTVPLHVQRAAQRVNVTLLDRLPQPLLDHIPTVSAARSWRRRLDPEPLPLEGVRRQRDHPWLRSGREPLGPFHPHPARVQLPQRTPEALHVRLLAGQRRDGQRLGPERRLRLGGEVVEGVLGGGGEGGVGSEFEVGVGGGGGVGDGLVEVDGLADVLGPVGGGGDEVRVGGLAGEVADQGDGGRVEGEGAEGLGEGVEDGVHLG